MRIAEFSDSFLPIVDGVGRVVYNYANALAEKGHECCVIAPQGEDNEKHPFRQISYRSIPLPAAPQYHTGVPALDIPYHEKISELSFDIAHAHSPFVAGYEALRVAKKQGIPLVATFHSKYYDDFLSITKSEELAKLGTRFVVDFYEKCDYVWSVSDVAAQTLCDYGYTGCVTVMRNGIDERSCDPDAIYEIRKKFNLDAPVLLYVGQINYKKNLARVLSAAYLLNRRGIRFKLVFAGMGPDDNDIRERAEALHLPLVMTGHLGNEKELCALYSAASLFVFPSLYDTAGLVVGEAAAMGVPSVVVRGTAAAEVIRDGENGFLCDDTDESLAAVCARVLETPAAGRAAGVRAGVTIPQEWPRVIDRVIAEYSRIIDEWRK